MPLLAGRDAGIARRRPVCEGRASKE
jgi:hypothetical protein